MSDFVERLRNPMTQSVEAEIMRQAADRIAQLEAEIANHEKMFVAHGEKFAQRDKEIERLREQKEHWYKSWEKSDAEVIEMTAQVERLRGVYEAAKRVVDSATMLDEPDPETCYASLSDLEYLEEMLAALAAAEDE